MFIRSPGVGLPIDEDETMVLSLEPKRDPRDRRPLIASVNDRNRNFESS